MGVTNHLLTGMILQVCCSDPHRGYDPKKSKSNNQDFLELTCSLAYFTNQYPFPTREGNNNWLLFIPRMRWNLHILLGMVWGLHRLHRQSHVHHIRNMRRNYCAFFSEFANTQTTESQKKKANHLQGVPLPVIIGVITPISRVITPLNHHTTTESLKFVDVFYSVLNPPFQLNFQLFELWKWWV